MDQYFFFAAAAVALALLRYGTYFYTIYKGETKPHAFSWFLWAVVTGIGTFVQFSVDGGPSAWALAFVSSTCLLISVISFFIGDRHYTKSDWFALIASFTAIPVWYMTDNPLYAVMMIIVIDFLTYWPTIRKSFHCPQTEPPVSYFYAGLRYFLMLFAVPDPTWENMAYIFFLMAMDWAFALYIVIRRIQLGYPWCEYVKT